MRTGGFPSRGSGVTVFVTNASSARAVSGAVSASRQPLRVQEEHSTGPSTQSRFRRAVELDDAAVAGAVAAGHRRLPRELRVGRERAHRLEHRLRARTPARRGPSGMRLRDEHRVDHDLRVRDEHGRLGVMLAAEAEHGRRTVERLGEVRQRRDPDAAAHEQRPRHVEPEAVPERAEDRDLVAGLERGERLRARARSGRSGTPARRAARGRATSAAAAPGPAPRA